LFELRGEVLAFLRDHPFQHCASFGDNLWLSQLAYLADIFARLNELNCSLQGDVTVFDVRDKINAMVKKFDWLVKCVENKISLLFLASRVYFKKLSLQWIMR
jgi:zinc finger BED domain-containing protein 5/7/8/9